MIFRKKLILSILLYFLIGSISLAQDCYDLIKEDGTKFSVCENAEGDFIVDLDSQIYDNTTQLTIPEGMTINCRKFIVKGDGYVNNTTNTGIICNGSVICDEFYVTNVGKNTKRDLPYFTTGCSFSLVTNIAELKYLYEIQPMYGTWKADEIRIVNGQGQNLSLPECSDISTKSFIININVSNGVIIEGHLIAEMIESTANIYLQYNGTPSNYAVITVGGIVGYNPWNNIRLIAGENTVINLCFNPNIAPNNSTVDKSNYNNWIYYPSSYADNIGYSNGTILYLCDDETGYNETWKPTSEGDLNYNTYSTNYLCVKDGKLFSPIELPAYTTKEKCMDEYIDFILGIDSSQKQKQENNSSHIFSPCSDKVKYSKFTYGNETYRVYRGNIVKCERDNNDK